MTLLLHARGVGKRYPDVTLRRRRGKDWALREVDLDLEQGEVVAIIGRNGAGKSTLLKVAGGVSQPSEGTLRRTRRIAPLIEVGAGFHPELTGRENVVLNGRLLGMSRRQVAAKLDEIVEFAELANVIDQPVKTYSSGMFMRLGFAVAVHTEPHMLIVDEVLAVGDLPFQIKCLDRIRAMRDEGVGVLFVSHNLVAVQSLATRAVLLEQGTVVDAGETRSVISHYYELLAVGTRGAEVGEQVAGAGLRLVDARVARQDGSPPELWSPGEVATLCLTVEADADVGPSIVGSTLHKEGAGMVGSWLGAAGPRVEPLRRGERHEVRLSVTLNVTAGSYFLDVGMSNADGSEVYFETQVAHFAVGHRPGTSGIVDFAPRLLEGC